MSKVSIAIVKLSEAFGGFWQDLGNDLGADMCYVESDQAHIPRDVACVLVAAGGSEPEAMQWLDAHDASSDAAVFVIGADPGRRVAVQMVSRGAQDYYALPDDLELLRNAAAEKVGQRRRALSNPHNVPSINTDAFANIIGVSSAIKEVLWPAARLLRHGNATALILGETGTGKELLARALHDGGPRRDAPFVAINCSALPDNLVESELFGHERGAFTSAHAAKPGLFEVAHGGTLFLDELGELPLDVQAKLLRVLDDKTIRRVGGTKTRQVDVRIIAATNDNLESAVRTGKFREDLYYRLSVIVLSLPPLRSREDDVILIAQALLSNSAKQHDMPAPKLNAEACSKLRVHSWPGNVRELKNVVERALLLSPPGEFFLDVDSPGSSPVIQTNGVLPFPAPLLEITRAAARATLAACEGNRSESARQLGISRKRLRGLLEDLTEDDLPVAWAEGA